MQEKDAMKLLGLILVALTITSCHDPFIIDTTPPVLPGSARNGS